MVLVVLVVVWVVLAVVFLAQEPEKRDDSVFDSLYEKKQDEFEKRSDKRKKRDSILIAVVFVLFLGWYSSNRPNYAFENPLESFGPLDSF